MNIDDSKSFNLRKRISIKINKHKKHSRFSPIKSCQKVNKVIRVHTRCALTSALENGTVDDFILPTHTNKNTLTWWDGDVYKLKIY